jgi:hypothetical protein
VEELIMVGITDRTGRVLNNFLDEMHASKNQSVRLDVHSSEGRLFIDREQPGDEVHYFEGRKVLLMDAYTSEEFPRGMLDFNGQEFILLDRTV